MTKKILSKENLSRIFLIIVGSFIIALGINLFIIPHNLLAAGVSGVAIVFQYLIGLPS